MDDNASITITLTATVADLRALRILCIDAANKAKKRGWKEREQVMQDLYNQIFDQAEKAARG